MIRLITIPSVIVLCDGAVKKYAETKLADGKTRKLLGGHIRLQLLHNPGAALGLCKKNPKLLLAINTGLLGVVAGKLAGMSKGEETLACTGLALLLGGGASNLIDRWRRGYVTDYFSIHAGERFRRLRRIVFNCSDFCVFLGCFLYLCGRKE